MRRTSAAALCAVLLFSVTAVAAVYLNAPTASQNKQFILNLVHWLVAPVPQ